MKHLVHWAKHSALPFWGSEGFDAKRGRFHERLDQVGTPIDVPHRAMVQARQIYVFASAAKLGWFPEGARLAEKAMANLVRRYCDEGARKASFRFSVDGNGDTIADIRDAYTHAFVLFALAWLYALDGDLVHLRLADKVIAFLDADLVDPVHAGMFDTFPVVDRSKRQNPLMHLLEAYLFLESFAPGRGYLDRASCVIDLFKHRLFLAEPGVVLEHYAEDWGPHGSREKADVFEPGHHFEWVWLMDRYSAMRGHGDPQTADTLYRIARESGIGPGGLIYDEVALDMQPRKRSHRVWPHTEAIKAAVVRHEAGDRAAAVMASAMEDRLFETFLDRPFPGGWNDHVSETGTPLMDYVPASSLYHLFLAATEAARATSAASLIEPAVN